MLYDEDTFKKDGEVPKDCITFPVPNIIELHPNSLFPSLRHSYILWSRYGNPYNVRSVNYKLFVFLAQGSWLPEERRENRFFLSH